MSTSLERVRKAFAGVYAVDHELGSGGMATVYLAHDLKHDREVAIKVLRPELTVAMGPDRFPREIRIIAKLSHPHILPLHDSGEIDGLLYYVMPYAEGESLRTRVERDGALPVPDVIRILKEVVDALAYAHAHNVVHRDIKPDNVMLSGRHALVMDFGVAKAVSDASSHDRMTTAGIALGTPTYMAPEQASADPNIDHRADIYAVGVLGYELLTGKPPFGGGSAAMILSAHMTQRPRAISAVRPGVPVALSDMIMRCLEKEVGDRYQSADQLLPILDALGTPSGGMTPTATAAVRATQRTRKRGVFIAAAVIVLAMLAGGAKVLLMKGGKSPDTAAVSVRVRRVAVLPLQNLSGDAAQDAFVNGMHDALINQLDQAGGAGGLTVISRTSVMRYRNTEKTMEEIGRELNVDAIIEGSVQRSGATMSVSAKLVEAGTERSLWSNTYDRQVTNALTTQREVAHTMATDIMAKLGITAQTAAGQTKTSSRGINRNRGVS